MVKLRCLSPDLVRNPCISQPLKTGKDFPHDIQISKKGNKEFFYQILNKPIRHSQSIMGMDDKHWPCLSHKPMAHHGSSWILSSFSRKLEGVQQWKLHSKCVNNQAPKLNFCYNIERAVLEKSVFYYLGPTSNMSNFIQSWWWFSVLTLTMCKFSINH